MLLDYSASRPERTSLHPTSWRSSGHDNGLRVGRSTTPSRVVRPNTVVVAVSRINGRLTTNGVVNVVEINHVSGETMIRE